jgi:hypothetical protein
MDILTLENEHTIALKDTVAQWHPEEQTFQAGLWKSAWGELYAYWDMWEFAVYLNFSSNMDKIPHTRCPQTFLSNYVFCENQYSVIPHYPLKVKIVWESAHDAVEWACTVGHSPKHRSASCCCLIFPHANYVDSLVLQLSTYATVRRNWNLNDSLYFAWSRVMT